MNVFPGAVQYPVNKSSASVLKPTVLLVVHITDNSALPNALGEAKYSNRDGSEASFEFVTNRDGSIVQCMDPLTQVAWTTGSLNAPNLALPTVKAMVGSSYGPNFFVFAQCENVGYEPGNPLTAAQVATLSRLAAWASKLSGLPVNRNTILGHRDFNSVDRHDCPTSGDLEALLAKVIAGANAILHPQEEAMTIVTYIPFPEGLRQWAANTAKTYTGYKPDGTRKTATLAAGSSAPASGIASISQAPQKAPNGSGFVLIADGVFAGYYVLRTDGTVAAPTPPPPPQVNVLDCAAEVAKAVDPLNVRIANIKAKVASGASDVADD